MPNFEYTASTKSGEIKKGQLQAASKAEAGKTLKSRGLFPLEIKKGKSQENAPPPRPPTPIAKPTPPSKAKQLGTASPASRERSSGPKAKLKPLRAALYLRQMQVMMKAGIPLHRAAQVLADDTSLKPQLQKVLGEIPQDLERGRLYSKSLERTGLFDRVTISTLRLGEESGRLEDVLSSLASSSERAVELQRKLVSRLSYPLIVLTLMVLGLVGIGHVMGRVLSSLPSGPEESGGLAQIFTAVFTHPGFLPGMVASLVLAFWGFKLLWKHNVLRTEIETWLLNLPLLGDLFRRVETNIICSQLSLLLGAGLTLDRGLKLCSEAVHTQVYREALKGAKSQLMEGCELSECFASSGVFPRDLLGLIAAGEYSGKLEETLSHAAAYCADQVERSLETALALLEPLLISFLGLVVGLVILVAFVPIFNNLQNL